MKRSLLITIVVLLMAALFVSCNANKAEEDQLFEVSIEDSARTLQASGVIDVDVESLVWFYEAEKTSGGFKTGQTEGKTAVKAGAAAGLQGSSLGQFSKGSWKFEFYGYDPANVEQGAPIEGAKPIFQQLDCEAAFTANYTLSVTLERGEGDLPAAKVVFDTLNWFHSDFAGEDHELTLDIFVEGELVPRISVGGEWIEEDGKAVFTIPSTSYITLNAASTLSFRVYDSFEFGEEEYEVLVGMTDLQIAATPGMKYTVSVVITDPVTSGITPVDSTATVTIDVAGTEATMPITTETAISVNSPVSVDKSQATNATTVTFPAGSFSGAQAEQIGNAVLTIDIMDVVEASDATFAIETNDSAIGAISLELQGVDTSSFNGQKVTIVTYISAGLPEDGVRVLYAGEGDLPDPDDVLYNPSTGKLSFTTTHFSDYVIYSGVAFNVETKVVYTTLQAAITAAQPGQTVKLLKSITSTTTSVALLDIAKSITLDGAGYTITSSEERTLRINQNGTSLVDVCIKNLIVVNNNYAGLPIITRGNIRSLTLDNVSVECTGTGQYTQALTIGGTQASAANINIINCTLSAPKYYAILAWNPVNLNVVGSSITGYANLYFKDGSAGSKVTISGGSLTSVGCAGKSNSFALINFEDVGNTVDIRNANITVSTPATDSSYQALVSFSEWYGPNTGNTVAVTGGSLTLSGQNAIYYLDSGAENTLSIKDVSGVEDFIYHSPDLEDVVAYMYMYGEAINCDGYYDMNELLADNSAYETHFFSNGEWLDLYTDVTIKADATLDMVPSKIGVFGIVCGDKTLSLADDVELIIPDGVTIATDVALDIFSAPEGFEVVPAPAPTGYAYAYTVAEIN